MNLLGWDISLLLLAQVLVTAGVVGLFSAATSFREGEAARISDLQMAALVELLTDNHPRTKTLWDVLEHGARVEDYAGSLESTKRTIALLTGGQPEGPEA